MEIPLSDFARQAQFDNVKISPDGKHLAVTFIKGDKGILAILKRDSLELVNNFSTWEARSGIYDMDWISPKRLVYSVFLRKAWDEQPFATGELFGVNVDGGQHKLLVGYRAGEKQIGSRMPKRKAVKGTAEVLHLLPDDPKYILITLKPWTLNQQHYRESQVAHTQIYRLNVQTGKTRRVDSVPVAQAMVVVDSDAVARIALGINKDFEQIAKYRSGKKAPWQDLNLEGLENATIHRISIGIDKKSLYVVASKPGETSAAYQYNLDTMKGNLLFQDHIVDISDYMMDFDKNRIIAVVTKQAQSKYHYIDKKTPKAKAHRMLRRSFPNENVWIKSQTDDGADFTFLVQSDKNPGDYYVYNTKSRKAEYLVSRKVWIDPAQMADMEALEFETRDGATIYGFLTKPKASVDSSKKLPLIVLPHGGPHFVRDYWGYDSQVQLLANRGYAVLQINYRGSDGYGEKYEDTGYGEWGGLMQDDITDATLNMVERGIADPERMCILGGSYGAYAALMAAVKEPDLFKCAIGEAGVYDLPMMFTQGDIKDLRYGIAYLKEALGTDEAIQIQRSPARNADKIKADILLIHGKQDTRAPIAHAHAMRKALDKHHKAYEWFTVTNEGHGFYAAKNRQASYAKILAFLEKHIGPGI